jgi:cytochrome d ubiquinol oxidase subunit I
LHVCLAAYAAVSIAVLGIHAAALLRTPDSELHRAAFRIALGLAIVSVPAQIVSGDLSAKHVAVHQPIKLAAAEGLFETAAPAPLSVGGYADEEAGRLVGAIEIPAALSILAFADPDAEVRGLEAFPRDEWPPVAIVHFAFDVMVGCGMAMAAVAAVGGLLWWRRREPWRRRPYLWAAVFASPLGLVAVEAGWVVTEVGRQPWIVRGFMRTADAVTSMPGLVIPMLGFTSLYVFLGVVVVALLRRHVLASTEVP